MFHPLIVKEVERLTDKAVTLSFDVPENIQEEFNYLAGQYLTIEETLDGNRVRRSYSICSAPFEGRLSVGIKQVPNGVFSTHANQNIQAGNILSVAPPEGRFVLDAVIEQTAYTGIAAGSGITPILAIAKEVLTQSSSSLFYLVYGNKTPDDEMFTKEIDLLKATYPSRFIILKTYSQKEVTGAGFGRIGESILGELEQRSGLQSKSYFLCGPEALIGSVSDHLQKKGILSDAIHFELFTAPSADEEKRVPAGSFQMQLTCDDLHHELQGSAGKTILDVALENKLDVPYSCQGGVCSSCIARIKKGAAEMTLNQILTDGEIQEGLVLTCQAHPTTPKIEVDYDDV
ncbi:MAG: 2Fe-2S iron-sulfur cluster-binding protein [Flavobacteriaceae bacterium]